MKSMIKELWHGNINPQEDSRNNSPEMKDLMEYMARHHDDLLKTMTDEQKEIFEKFEDCWGEYASYAEEAIFEYALSFSIFKSIENAVCLAVILIFFCYRQILILILKVVQGS